MESDRDPLVIRWDRVNVESSRPRGEGSSREDFEANLVERGIEECGIEVMPRSNARQVGSWTLEVIYINNVGSGNLGFVEISAPCIIRFRPECTNVGVQTSK